MRGYSKDVAGTDLTVVAGDNRQTPGGSGLRTSPLDSFLIVDVMPWDVVIAERQNDVRLLTIKHQGENETRE